MTLLIDLTPTEQERVIVAARQRGLAPAEYVKQLVTQNLPPVTEGAVSAPDNTNAQAAVEQMAHKPPERDSEQVARVRAVRGKYAHTASTSGTEELHRERQRDKENEEALLRGFGL